jgi:cyanophycinase
MAKRRRPPVKRPQEITPPPRLQPAPTRPRGSLVIIGGREEKTDGNRGILEELARRAAGGSLVVATMASEEPDAQWEEYRKVFRELGVRRIAHLDVRQREELIDNPRLDLINGAKVIFFAGGDQLKITSRFGGTALCDHMRELYRRGATIAGTSSGASVMSETMMVAGAGGESHEGTDSLKMAPGLGLMPGVIIDQHFAERGRMGRLLAAVAQNPRLLGIGIDENTAVVFDGNRKMTVMGSGAVYLVDGRAMTFTSATESDARAASIYGMVVHVLGEADDFDLQKREPVRRKNGSRGKAKGSSNGRG